MAPSDPREGVAGVDKEIRALTVVRRGKRQSATKTIDAVDFDNLDEINCNFYIQKLSTLKNDLLEFNSKIKNYMIGNEVWTDEQYGEYAADDEEYDDKIGLMIDKLNVFKSSSRPWPCNSGSHHPALLPCVCAAGHHCPASIMDPSANPRPL